MQSDAVLAQSDDFLCPMQSDVVRRSFDAVRCSPMQSDVVNREAAI